MKKLMALSLALLMTLTLAACGSGSSDVSEDGTFTPTKTVTWTCTSSAGGGPDIFSRKIAEIMTNEDMVNGQTIVISNETDGAGEVGRNKIAATFEDAMNRAKNVACVLNAKRLNTQTPCTKAGKCMDCKAAARICRLTAIHEYAPSFEGPKVHVYLVDEDLGY